MSENEAKKFVTAWLWESTKRKTIHREWDHDLICDTAQMVLDGIAQLQRDNEALRKDNANIEELYQKLADYVDKLSGPDEHSVFETIDNTMAKIETLKQNLAAAEAKCVALENKLKRYE